MATFLPKYLAFALTLTRILLLLSSEPGPVSSESVWIAMLDRCLCSVPGAECVYSSPFIDEREGGTILEPAPPVSFYRE